MGVGFFKVKDSEFTIGVIAVANTWLAESY